MPSIVRATMANLISRIRILINDPQSPTAQFLDSDIQDIMDETRGDSTYLMLTPYPTYSGSTISYLDYYADFGNWEDGGSFTQFRTITVTPSVQENIVGHWKFAQTTLPPVYLNGKYYDIYRCAADLLERWAARWVLRYSMTVDGQGLQRGQVTKHLTDLAKVNRTKQNVGSISAVRSDIASSGASRDLSLAPTDIDYIAKG